jgi:hypothetical protein
MTLPALSFGPYLAPRVDPRPESLVSYDADAISSTSDTFYAFAASAVSTAMAMTFYSAGRHFLTDSSQRCSAHRSDTATRIVLQETFPVASPSRHLPLDRSKSITPQPPSTKPLFYFGNIAHLLSVCKEKKSVTDHSNVVEPS